MPVFKPDQFVAEISPVEGASEPNQTLWISEAGQLTQFGAFVEVLQPGSRSSMKPERSRWLRVRPRPSCALVMQPPFGPESRWGIIWRTGATLQRGALL